VHVLVDTLDFPTTKQAARFTAAVDLFPYLATDQPPATVNHLDGIDPRQIEHGRHLVALLADDPLAVERNQIRQTLARLAFLIGGAPVAAELNTLIAQADRITFANVADEADRLPDLIGNPALPDLIRYVWRTSFVRLLHEWLARTLVADLLAPFTVTLAALADLDGHEDQDQATATTASGATPERPRRPRPAVLRRLATAPRPGPRHGARIA
jgi:hypothetical protein